LAEEEEDEPKIIIPENFLYPFYNRPILENIFDILSKKDEDELKLLLEEEIEDILNSIENAQKKKLNQKDFELILIIEEEIAGKDMVEKKIFLEYIINIIKCEQKKDFDKLEDHYVSDNMNI